MRKELKKVMEKYIIMKKVNKFKKVIEKIAIKAASSNVNETCSWITYQPKVPESVKKLKKH